MSVSVHLGFLWDTLPALYARQRFSIITVLYNNIIVRHYNIKMLRVLTILVLIILLIIINHCYY